MATRTVLVVDSSEVEAQIVERSLRDSGSRIGIVLARTTLEAEMYLHSESLQAAAEKPTPDLILIDVNIPPIGGLELLKRIKSDNRTRWIPIVMMSERIGESDVQALYRAGANSYLDKPSDMRQFNAMISTTARYWLSINLNAATAARVLVGTSSHSLEP